MQKTTKKVVRATEVEKPDINKDYIKRLVQEYKKAKEMIDALETRNAEMRSAIHKAVIDHGQPDNKGNVWLALDDIELKRERRVSKSFNSAAAEAWAKTNGHWDTVKEVIEVLNEDKLLGLAWNNDDIQEVLKTFYEEKETWALKV